MRSNHDVHYENHIVNMTNDPLRVYENSTGEIAVFFPCVRTFCEKSCECFEKIFPKTACYVFTSEMEKEICQFKRHGRNVAVVVDYGVGRDGARVATLVSAYDKKRVLFRKHILGLRALLA